jgi:ribosomal protein L37AE/L43A
MSLNFFLLCFLLMPVLSTAPIFVLSCVLEENHRRSRSQWFCKLCDKDIDGIIKIFILSFLPLLGLLALVLSLAFLKDSYFKDSKKDKTNTVSFIKLNPRSKRTHIENTNSKTLCGLNILKYKSAESSIDDKSLCPSCRKLYISIADEEFQGVS